MRRRVFACPDVDAFATLKDWPELAAGFGMETRQFKLRVRRLKELGLTESLTTGYRISPRGRAFLDGR